MFFSFELHNPTSRTARSIIFYQVDKTNEYIQWVSLYID
jgi:hypothetical protein